MVSVANFLSMLSKLPYRLLWAALTASLMRSMGKRLVNEARLQFSMHMHI